MSFQLFISKNNSKIVITDYKENQQYNLFSTFNEKLSVQDNNQHILTFSLARYVNNQLNPYLQYLIFGTTISLIDRKNMFEFIITSIAPQINAHNIIYNFTCNDKFSYTAQRLHNGYGYSTTELGSIQTIYQIANKVLQETGLSSVWYISTFNRKELPNKALLTTRITLDVENSNPYNVLIEGLNTLNASMYIDYNDHSIHFYQKTYTLFSGFRYRPEVNLRSLSATYSLDQFATILHVTGGTDEYNMPVMLVPPMPDAISNFLTEYLNETGQSFLIDHTYSEILTFYDSDYPNLKFRYTVDNDAPPTEQQKEYDSVQTFCILADKLPHLGQFLSDFTYFRNNHLMSLVEEDGINDILYNKDYGLAAINAQLRPVVSAYYRAEWDLMQALVDGETILEAYMACFNQAQSYFFSNSSEQIDYDDLCLTINQYEKQLMSLFNNRVIALYNTLYGPYLYSNDNKPVALVNNIIQKIQYYRDMRDEAYTYYLVKQREYYAINSVLYDPHAISTNIDDTTIDITNLHLEEDLQYYYKRFQLAVQMIGFFDEGLYGSGGYFCINCDYLQVKVDNGQVVYEYSLPSLDAEEPIFSNFVINNYILPDNYMVCSYYNLLFNYFFAPILQNTSINSLNNSFTFATEIILNNVSCTSNEQTITYTIPFNALVQQCYSAGIFNNVENLAAITQLLNAELISFKTQCIQLNDSDALNNYTTLHIRRFIPTVVNNDLCFNITYTGIDSYNYTLDMIVSIQLQLYLQTLQYNNVNNNITPLYNRMLNLQQESKNKWDELYQQYGNFIYETTYSNTEELDSVSLYNQAIVYFESLKHPKSNYSISVVHPKELEQIGVENLCVNSRIRIYDSELNLEESDGIIEPLNNISYTNNELIVTRIEYELRKPEEANISVQQDIQYQSILQKLIKSIK